jgi:hypothetical protein
MVEKLDHFFIFIFHFSNGEKLDDIEGIASTSGSKNGRDDNKYVYSLRSKFI